MRLLRTNLPGFALNEEVLETALDHPWADEELPSLVAVSEDGEVVGFIRSQVRRMRFDGRPIRGVCCGDLVVSPEYRKGAPGALLLGRLLSGPQDITWSDSTTDIVVRAWRAFGGSVDHARSTDFMLVLHPAKWARRIFGARIRGHRVGRDLMPVGAFPAQAVGRWISNREMPVLESGFMGQDADPNAIVEALPAISQRLRVGVEWDTEALDLTFQQIEALGGKLSTRVVHRGRSPIGWYAYVRHPVGTCRLLHLAALERSIDAVLADLVDHATAAGGTVLAGRAEPHLERPLRKRFAVLGFAWQPVIRTRDSELAAALATSASLLTRLDGELSLAH